MSRQADKGAPRRERDDVAGVIAPPPLIYLVGLGLGLGLDAALGGGSLPPAVRFGLGGVLLVAGLALQMWWIGSFQRAGTPMPPWEPTTALVTDGPYRVSRNPAYLSDALLVAAVALLVDAPWALLSLPVIVAVMEWGVIRREERYLERLFGEEYRAFKRRRRRWI